jgi:hypothetical protein
MSTQMMYSTIGVWFAIVAAGAGIGVLSGVPVTLSSGALVLFMGLVPPAIVLKLFGGAEAQTIAQILHPVEPDTAKRDRS